MKNKNSNLPNGAVKMTWVQSQSCLMSASTCRPSISHISTSTQHLPGCSLLKSMPFISSSLSSTLSGLVSGLPPKVTYTLSLVFENIHPNPHLLIFLFFCMQKCVPAHIPGKTWGARATLAWKGHFHTAACTVSSGKLHSSQRRSLSFPWHFQI